MKKIFISLFFIAGLIFSAGCVQAQGNAKGISINPFFREVTIEKNQENVRFNLEISNMTEAPAIFYLSALDFGALSESGGVAFLGAENDFEKKYGLASWISLEKDALAIGPGEKQAVAVTIENKESLSPGGHYAAIVLKLENENSSADDGSEVNLKSSLASLIFARKIGGEIEELALREKDFSKNIFALPSAARLRFQNTGNVYLKPRGTIKISDPSGREIKKGVINAESGIILPETFRVFAVNLKTIALAFVPGRYSLDFFWRYDGREAFEIESEKFWHIPPLDILALIILAGGAIIWKKYGRKKREQE